MSLPRRTLALGNKPKPYLMAHRGNQVAYPENTLAAFRRAFSDGADILETDLHLTADGVFVCIHDGAVDRTTNGHGLVAQMTLAQIRALEVTGAGTDGAVERIPTLEEAMAILPPDVALALELKTDRFLEKEVCARLADELERGAVRERTVALSFSLPRLRAMQSAAPDIPIGWITISRVWPMAGVQLLGPFWPLILANPLYVWLAHRRGQVVCPLDPTPDRRLWLYRWMRCDAVLSNDPEKTKKALTS